MIGSSRFHASNIALAGNSRNASTCVAFVKSDASRRIAERKS